MGAEHCVVNGKRCSKCCEVLTISDSGNFRAWRKYARWVPGCADSDKEIHKVARMVRKISKRRAKKINGHLVSTIKNGQSYFTCKNYRQGACQDYSNRPYMCSGYPYYNRTAEDFAADKANLIGLYTPECTYYAAQPT